MSEPVQSQTLTFHCWRNLSTGAYQWRVVETGEAHGPELPTEEAARSWFQEHGGFREPTAGAVGKIAVERLRQGVLNLS